MADRMDFTRTEAVAGPKRPGYRTFPNLNGDYSGRIELGKPRSRDEIAPPLRTLIGEILAGWKRLPLVILGPTGTGKTCAALAFADAVQNPFFLSFADLIRLNFAPWDQQAGMWREVERSELLILDDVTVGLDSENSLKLRGETLWRVLDVRERRANSQTVVTTNCRREKLADSFGPACDSRLFCGSHFELFGSDRRFEQQAR
jgi:DNA replication protein DnaC